MTRIDPHSFADPSQGRTTHLDLDLEVDFQEKRLKGTAVLHLEGAPGGILVLDSRDLQVEWIRDGEEADLAWSAGEKDPVLGSPLRVEIPGGTKVVKIRYATSPGATALQWLEPAQTAGGKRPYLFSQCQAIHARSMVPLQDTPAIRFTYSAAVTVPAGLKAVMSAAPGEEERGPREETRTFRFRMPQPIPSYLLALAAGNLASRDLGPRSRVYTEPEMLDAAAWEFEEVDAMLRTGEEIFGPYRWERFDFLVMPPSFPYGGMENPRLTFLTPTLLAGDRSLVNVLAHELAHSWTGNLVTNATMNDFWLNEGFTVWAERRILERLEGEEAAALAAAIGRNGLQEELERFGADSPLTRLRTDLEGMDPDEVYSLVPYEKGFLFVALLERTAGREVFDAFVKDYIERFAFTSITTEEFEHFLEEKLPGLAEKVDARRWIHGPGLPENAPSFPSRRLEAVRRALEEWKGAGKIDPSLWETWSSPERQLFLQGLPRKLSREQCAWLEENFRLSESRNAEILAEWLVLAAASAYEPAFPAIRDFLGRVGRMKFLKPIYKALLGNERTRAFAEEVFREHSGGYHPIAREGLEKLLARA